MVTASALVPLWNRADEWARRIAMIREAASFLYLSTYYIEYDEYGVELLDALDAAQRRGVAVNLLIDGFGQQLGTDTQRDISRMPGTKHPLVASDSAHASTHLIRQRLKRQPMIGFAQRARE